MEVIDSNLARASPTTCGVLVPVVTVGNSGPVLMATFYSITAFAVLRWWNKPALAPRNTKYFTITNGFLWITAILLVVPTLVNDAIEVFCTVATEVSSTPFYAAVLSFIFALVFLILLNLLFLVIIICLIKTQTITENSTVKKASIKFGFFPVIGQGISGITQVIGPAVNIYYAQNCTSIIRQGLVITCNRQPSILSRND